jgi:PKD repeat protein
MKRTFTLIIFLFAVFSMAAQTQNLMVSGTLTNNLNGSAIPNHEVTIHNDSLAGTTGYFHHTVLTNNSGYYYDSIPLQPANNQGTVHIGTMDCQNILNVYSASYGPTNYNVQHNFSICYSGATCNADFYFYQDSTMANTFSFVPISVTNVSTWLWDFGDGTTATVTFPMNPNVTHTFAGSAVAHNVCLTVYTNSGCSDTKCQVVTIGSGGTCIANFTYSDSTNIMNPVQFMDLSTTSGGVIISWLWNFGDPASGTNNTSTAQNPSHIYAVAGTYNVCLTIHGSDSSCYATTCKTIALGSSGGCSANFTYTSSPNTQTPVQFADLSTTSGTGIVSWNWDFGDPQSGINNTSAMQNPTHLFSQVGNYTVCLTFHSGDSCFDVTCQTIYVGSGAGCQAYYTYVIDSIAPAGAPVLFTDHSQGNPLSWAWDFGDGATSNLQNPTHTYAANGSYTVCLTIYGDSCQDTYCRTVQIGNTPGCMSYFTHTATYLSVNFQGFITNGNYLQGGVFTWSFGDGTAGQGQSVTHVYPGTGSYTVILTAVDSSGCSSTYAELITLYDSINTHQVYGQVYADDFPITSGLAMIFSLDSTANYSPYVNVANIDSMGVYYFTMVPDGNYFILAIPILPGGYLPTYYGDVLEWQNASIIQLGQASNPYDIHLLQAYTNPGGNGTINGQINMGQIKSIVVDKVTMLLMNSQLQPINYYKVNTAGDFTFPALGFGTYYLKAEIPGVTSDLVKVEISDANPVASVTMTFSGNRILGMDEPNATLTAGILYPNPVSDVVNLSLKASQVTTIQVDVYNMEGQTVGHSVKALGTGGTVITIPVGNLAKGIYTFRVHSDQGINIVRKLIK